MRKNLQLFLLFFILSTVIISAQSKEEIVRARKEFRYRNAQLDKIDTRIDNMHYWREMAKKGYIQVQPEYEVEAPVYTSSNIDGINVITDNSPDVPVSSATNNGQSENSIFVNPFQKNMVLNSNNSTNYPVSTLYGTSYFLTDSYGNTWGGSPNGAGGSNSGDPAAAISLTGRYYIGFINNNYGQGVSYSTNSGLSWTPVVVANAPSGFSNLLDKNHLWIDNSPTSPYQGYLYDAWTPFGGGNDSEIEISRSTNNGVSWGTALNISSAVNAGSHNQGVNVQTGPNGEVYAIWAIYDSWPQDEKAIGFAKSTNGGTSFQPATRIINNIRGIRNTETSKNMRVNSFPSMAVDISGGANSGSIYVVWANIGFPGINSGSTSDIYMIRSTNQGSTWSTPIKVNTDPIGSEHYFPWITCDPETGILSVIFYDDRNVSSSQVEVWVANSYDGGATWEDMKISDIAFTPAPISGLASGYFGDYLGISARGGYVYPVWTDNRNSRPMAYVSPYQVSSAPIARFNATPTSGTDPLLVSFSDDSFPGLGTLVSWNWNFGDGNSSTEQNPQHLYSNVGTYTVSLTVSDGTNESTVEKVDFIDVFDNYIVPINVNAYWNMVSVPLLTSDMAVQSVFPGAVSQAFSFENGYVSHDQLDNGIGYWIKFSSPASIDVVGELAQFNEPYVAEGWNIIGPFRNKVPVSSVTSNPAGLIQSAFFGYEDNYFLADTLYPGKGYWVKTSGAGVLNYNTSAKKINQLPAIKLPANYATLKIGEDPNKLTVLGLGWDSQATNGIDIHLGESEMPPFAPEGFDARLNISGNLSVNADIREIPSDGNIDFNYYISLKRTDKESRLNILFNIPSGMSATLKDGINGLLFSKTLAAGEHSVSVDVPGLESLIINLRSEQSPLVNFTSFKAAEQNGTMNVSWIVASEKNVAGYELQRSSDNESWLKVVDLKADAGSQNFLYTFTDTNPGVGEVFYRIKLIGSDGSFAFSSVLSAGSSLPGEFDLSQNYPNPANPSTVIAFNLPVDAAVNLRIYDMIGREISSHLNKNYSAGRHEIKFVAGDLASGMYIYNISVVGSDGSKYTMSKKMMILK
ncbi:MAG: PKD domain-containing protein [Ignavibacteriales bacterium]|nr:PKD domain-containing protein [Ignavibacteriales bacterium]MCF8316296.1 PKD domain-containing protein [Ignavibacteriales bacterium]MCF8437880.1 PKD domain-containing protein [Ignavibacteriales bacterium]